MRPCLSLSTLLVSLASISLLVPGQVLAALYTVKPGSTFRVEPNGEAMSVGPSFIETPALQMQNGWCFFKLRDGRGRPINPPAGWTECSNLNKFVGM